MAYSPTLGRWTQADPTGYVDGMNLFEGLVSNPITNLDPLGTQATKPTTQPGDWGGLPHEPDLKPPSYPAAGASRKDREKFAHDLAMYYQQWAGNPKNNACLQDGPTLVAQWMGESDWGREKANQQSHNLGNIKGTGPAGSIEVKTWEVIKGKKVEVVDKFRKYNNLDEFFADYNKLICENDRYKNARGKSGRDYYQALKDAEYATDPDYVAKSMRIYRQLGG